MKQGRITGLAHIGIFVKNMKVSIDFYKKLGFTLDDEESNGMHLAFLSAGSCLLELIEKKDDPARPAGVVDHIAVEVDDIEAAVTAANANGIEIAASAIGGAAILGGIKNVFFQGPDGERLEFFEYMK